MQVPVAGTLCTSITIQHSLILSTVGNHVRLEVDTAWNISRNNTKAATMTNERKNITQPSDWWAAFEEQAKAEGLTLAAWLGEAAKAKLPPKVAKKLTERPPANRPKKEQ